MDLVDLVCEVIHSECKNVGSPNTESHHPSQHKTLAIKIVATIKDDEARRACACDC